MNTAIDTLAVSVTQDLLVGIAPFVVGLAIAVGLIWAVRAGIRRRRKDPPAPRPEEQPRLPDGGPVREVSEVREPQEFPQDGERLYPHQLSGTGTRRSPHQGRRRWDKGSSGAFGSGGPGGRQ